MKMNEKFLKGEKASDKQTKFLKMPTPSTPHPKYIITNYIS